MKHDINIKLPKYLEEKLGRSVKEVEEEKQERRDRTADWIRTKGSIVAGVALGYLAGYNRGMSNTINKLTKL